MNNLERILDYIDEYTIDELFEVLRGCNVSFEEFIKAAKEAGVPVKRTIREQLASKFANCEEEDWEMANQINTEEAYQNYLNAYQEGNYRDEARDRMRELQKQAEQGASDEIWRNLDATSIAELQDFVNNYPDSGHHAEAVELLKELRRKQYLGVNISVLARKMEEIQTTASDPQQAIYDLIVGYIHAGDIKKEELLSAIADDHNFISGAVANLLWSNGIITDFSQAGIDDDFIAYMMSKSNTSLQEFRSSSPLSRITKSPCTEVYFWGIPSSGKTCALGAILSVANSGKEATMQRDNDCQGYGYMNKLTAIFNPKKGVGTMPPGTPTTSTYEMGFTLEDKEGKEHPITCIDLAGELVLCMYKHDAGEALTEQQENVLKTLTDILIDNRTSNRKMHFFVIEYGAENREYAGLTQQFYLDAAVRYIQRTKIFEKGTDGVYVLITKVDKAKAVGKELQDKLRAYISDNYQNFYSGLKSICKKNEINGGNVEIIPFTLGTVCFQDYCKFNGDTAAAVVRKLIKRTYGYKPGKIGKLAGIFKS